MFVAARRRRRPPIKSVEIGAAILTFETFFYLN